MPAKISRQNLIDELHRLADELGRTPSRKQMNELGQYSRRPYDTEFGGWNDALRAAGFDVNKPVELTRQELLSELGRLAAVIDRVPRQKDMNERGKYSERAYKRVFENWNDALRTAGFEPNKEHGIEYPTLICEQCGDKYQVKPSRLDISRFCSDGCKNKYKMENWLGSNNPHPHAGMRETIECEWCGEVFEVHISEVNEARFCNRECLGKHHRAVRSGSNSPRWRGGYEPYYGPNWYEQRQRAKRRDDFECQECGIENDLIVHHKTAMREFAKQENPDWKAANALDNLVTLCRKCHAKIENGASNGFGD